MPSLTYEVSHEDVTALRNTDTEQINKHDHVMTVGTRGQSLVTDLVDEEGDNHLRKTI